MLVMVEIRVCDLERVEKQSGAAEVDVVGGDADHDGAEGVLDVSAGVGRGEREGGLAGSAVTEVFHRTAGLVMVVAEAFAAHGRTATAAVFRADVAAAEGGGRGLLRNLESVGHGIPWVLFLRKIFKRKDMAPDHRRHAGLKSESPAFGPGFRFSLI